MSGTLCLVLLGLDGVALAEQSAIDPDEVPIVATIRQIDRIDLRLEIGAVRPLGNGDGRADFAIEVAPRPDYWYQLGIAARTESSRTIVISSSNQSEERITTRDGLAVSFRFFKRLGPVVLNAGIVDSHAGVGAELRGFDDRLRLELLVYEWPDQMANAPRLRAGASAQWRWFFARVYVDNALDSGLRGVFAGGGLRWRDPDLKQLAFWATR